jgi:hypothetical protein
MTPDGSNRIVASRALHTGQQTLSRRRRARRGGLLLRAFAAFFLQLGAIPGQGTKMRAYAQGSPTEQHSSWTIQSEDSTGVRIVGRAALTMTGTQVAGIFETYFEGYPLPPVREDVNGKRSGDHMELEITNPTERTSAHAQVTRIGTVWRGTWEAADTHAHGTIELQPQTSGAGGTVRNPLTANSAIWWQADAILKHGGDQLSNNQVTEALQSFQEAAELFKRAGDPNKRGWALNGMGTAEQRLGRYEQARQHFSEVLALGDSVDQGIRQSAHTGLVMVRMALGLDPND